MAVTTGKLIVGNFSKNGRYAEPSQPTYDRLLELSVTPQMVASCVLHGNDAFWSGSSSRIAPETVDTGHYAENSGNHVEMVSLIWENYLDPDDDFEEETVLFFGYAVELQIDGVFMHANYGEIPSPQYSSTVEDDMRRRAEDAFIRAASLIGVPVSRGLIIGT